MLGLNAFQVCFKFEAKIGNVNRLDSPFKKVKKFIAVRPLQDPSGMRLKNLKIEF